MKIGIIGYYGFNNLGDELNLYCMMENLRKQFKEPEFIVFSDCRVIEGEVNYRIVGRNYFPANSATKDVLNSCDLLIIGGGGLIYLGEYWFPFMDEGIRVPYIIYRVGIDDRKIDQQAVNSYRRLFLQAEEATVRDTYSANLCRKYLREDVRIVPEAIWNHPYKGRKDPAKGSIKVGINLRSFSERIFPYFKEFFASLAIRGYDLYFIPCQVMKSNPNLNDNKFHRLAAPPGAIIIPDGTSIADRCHLLSQMDLCIGMRLHFSLLALRERIPVLALNYNNKVKGLMDEIGLGEFTIDLEGESIANSLKDNFTIIERERGKIRSYLNLHVPEFEEGAKEFILCR